MIWVNKYTGAGTVYTNMGRQSEADRPNLGGSLFRWVGRGVLYSGLDRGANEHFVDLEGTGRASIMYTRPVPNDVSVHIPNIGSYTSRKISSLTGQHI